MTDEKRNFLEKTLMFRVGSEQIIWGIALDTVEVDAHEVDEFLGDGWYQHPFEARDGHAAKQERVRLEALEAQRLKDEQAEAEKQRLLDEQEAEAKRQREQEARDEEARLKGLADEAAKADNDLKAKLIEEATGLGLTVDKRWGTRTIQEAIDEAKKPK